MTNSIRVFAPAKINLFLHVGDRRADGYHPLQSLAVFTHDVGDTLVFRRAGALTLSIDGQHAASLDTGDDNLVLRAARALHPSRGAALTLTKNLPVASGIGGGSADAAAALRLLSYWWNIQASDTKLVEIATELGSDVPVCVASAPAWMEGRGEILRRVAPMPSLPIVLVNPRVEVSTGNVFATLVQRRGAGMALPSGFRDRGSLFDFLVNTGNDLEVPARAIAPVIGAVLDTLAAIPGVRLSRMSGSGATCFALFDDDERAQAAAVALQKAWPAWWVKAGETGLA